MHGVSKSYIAVSQVKISLEMKPDTAEHNIDKFVG